VPLSIAAAPASHLPYILQRHIPCQTNGPRLTNRIPTHFVSHRQAAFRYALTNPSEPRPTEPVLSTSAANPPASPAPANAHPHAHPAPGSLPPLPLPAALPLDLVLTTLEKAARRGRLAGFERPGPKSPPGVAFHADAFGTPFDRTLDATFTASPDGAGGTLHFALRSRRQPFAILLIVLGLTVWPGILLTRSGLESLLPSADWLIDNLALWYLPLTILSIPLTYFPALARTRSTSHQAALGVIGKIATELGQPVPAGATPPDPGASNPPTPASTSPAAANSSGQQA
jgi:hypothetical protein